MNDRELLQQAVYKITELRRENTDDATYEIEDVIWNRLSQCDRCGEVNPAEIHTCSPKQEPYCYVYKEHGEDYFAPPDGYYPADAQPLYTAPPQQEGCAECGKQASDGWALYCVECNEPRKQRTYTVRKWQGLTDEEINDHWINAMWNTEGTRLPIPEFARAIEAALKAKNA